MLLRTFGWSFAVTVLGLAFAFWAWGWQGFAIVAILSVLEISLSFDNAVVNASVLKKMNAFWQKIFLTIGILIAVFGMRLVFPVVIVAVTAQLGPIEAVQLAIDDKARYEELVTAAHPAIASFGGMFLLMIFLDFIFEEREHKWLAWLERPLAKLGRLDVLSIVIALITLLVAATTVATNVPGSGDKSGTVLLSGVAGLLTYLVVGGLSDFFEGRLEEDEAAADEAAEKQAAEAAKTGRKPQSAVGLAGKAAFFLFLYLEVLDASFSFDGVIGAFAITNDIFEMALGLGIGAMYVRSLTVYLVRQGTLDDYVYLEHGAHYAIGALAVLLLVSIQFHINEVITGLIGVLLIGASFWSSVVRNRRLGENSSSKGTAEVSSGV
ncbi:DUF475 domain-containing protein [Streptomyces sp. NPDC059506]|uniref:DUF475 domain-containing protein n=1 Tax=unclassified Streptomyces TaxID=2593676 RepID=UPI000CABB1ED|nr:MULTISPECIES: DUF475 domain-containing protein [unclassified Streptomyces]MCZ2527843.1 DUF475 domain-containing protein [Streptomyces sp. HB2AG]PLW67864.1 hypothetical protein C0036_21090 [Streptomyces sp. DJ]QMV23603.1 DUF475 domain-containing protein [Streptomyces sp. SCUT-3]